MKSNKQSIQRNDGFTLVEMAMVLAIIALLMAGLLPTLSGQIEQSHRSETRKQLAEIQQAMIGYTIVNGRLPCPAKAGIATNTAGAGISDCALTSGVVPWVTLGTNETDAWGRRFTYSATSSFITSNFSLSTNGNLTVLSAVGGTSVASTIPAVIISHGTNGFGAYTTQGIKITGGTNADEVENSDADTDFVSHDATSSFDDMVVWISPNILFNRMVEAGKLP